MYSRNYFLSENNGTLIDQYKYMRKLTQRKVRWIISEKERGMLSVYSIAKLQHITPRWARELYREYKKTGRYPYPKPPGRKSSHIKAEECRRVLEMKEKHPLSGATTLEKLLDREGVHIPHNRVHRILKERGLAKDEPKKQKRKRWIRYERKHSNSLWHMDWFEVTGGNMTIIEDDASRYIVEGRVFNRATGMNSARAMENALGTYAKPKQVITDYGSQFTAVPREGYHDPRPTAFQRLLEARGIKHIRAKVKHPQTNGKVEKGGGGTIKQLVDHFGSLEKAIHYYNFERPHWSLNIDECETPFKAYVRKMWPSMRRKFIGDNRGMVATYAPKWLEYGMGKVKIGGR